MKRRLGCLRNELVALARGEGGNQTESAGVEGSWTQAQIPLLTSPDNEAGSNTRYRGPT